MSPNAGSLPGAGSAVAGPILLVAGVGDIERVPVDAPGLAGAHSGGTDAAADIDANGDRFHVVWVDAAGATACMVDHQPVRDRPDQDLVHSAVREHGAPLVPTDLSVAELVGCPRPDPAARRINGVLALHAFPQRADGGAVHDSMVPLAGRE